MDTNLATAYQMIPLGEIVPDPDNVRISDAGEKALDDLVASIKEQGIIQPISVRPLPPALDLDGPVPIPARYMVIVGHRRFAAAGLAGLAAIPAVIREGMSEGEIRLMQLAENNRRADMSALDVWAAIEAAAKAGLSNASIALAINRSERQVQQFRAMGSLHPILQAHIRDHGDMPDEGFLRVICQASQERQAEAFEAAIRQSAHGWQLWSKVKAALTVQRISLGLARFDLDRYTGPRSGELFGDPDTEYALDPKLFMELQGEWLETRCAFMVKAGFANVEKLQPGKYSSDWAAPDGAEAEYRYEDLARDKNGKDKMPPRKARPDLIYAVGLKDTGEVTERLYAKKQPKPKAEKKAKVPGQPEVDPLEGVGSDFSVAFTAKGVERLEQVKRECLATALGEDSPLAREQDELIAILSYLLATQIKPQSYNGPSTPPFPLLDAEGQIDIDGKLPELIGYARSLVAFAVQQKHQVWKDHVERIGAWIKAPVAYPVTVEDLAHLKGPALTSLGRKLGWDDKAHPRQKDKRTALLGALDELLPEHLSMIGWQVKPEGGVLPPRVCGRESGADTCSCGWPEEVCEEGPDDEDLAEADGAVAGALAATEGQDEPEDQEQEA